MAQAMSVMAQAMAAPMSTTPTVDRLRIDFLYLDLSTCARCRGTDRNLESALEVVRDVLEATGVEVGVNRFHVESAGQARYLGLVTSPTIRVNGRDIALELRETSCEECTCEACIDGDGDGEQIACRVWMYPSSDTQTFLPDADLPRLFRRSPVRVSSTSDTECS